MNLKASVAPQPALGHSLLAPIGLYTCIRDSSFPPLQRGGQGGWSRAQPSTGLLKGILTGRASPRSSHLQENVRGVRSVRRPPRTAPSQGWEILRAVEVCVETDGPAERGKASFC